MSEPRRQHPTLSDLRQQRLLVKAWAVVLCGWLIVLALWIVVLAHG